MNPRFRQLRSSVLSYPERGPYGDGKYRGNTSGFLVRDLLLDFKPNSVLDPMAGSGTTKDVCKELGIPCDAFDLRGGFDAGSLDLGVKRYDLVFLHPPYMAMVRYSDESADLSRIKRLDEYLHRLSEIILRLARHLTKEGYIIILIGNRRKNGKLYPLGACLEVLFLDELQYELIKVQHGVKSMRRYGPQYANRNWIPIMHEKVLIFTGFKSITWEELTRRALTALGGEAHLREIYKHLEDHPKTADNPTWQATIRRTLQESFTPIDGHGIWAT